MFGKSLFRYCVTDVIVFLPHRFYVTTYGSPLKVEINLAQPLDFEVSSTVSAVVTATDEFGSDTASFVLTITDVNETPAFNQSEYTGTIISRGTTLQPSPFHVLVR